jgi:hypothetical protein
MIVSLGQEDRAAVVIIAKIEFAFFRLKSAVDNTMAGRRLA